MKPLLERKRRARINRCLDELKDLMVVTLQAEGENVSKLEKADILELTVRHLHKLKQHNALGVGAVDAVYADKFRAGFAHCATEVSNYLTADVRAPPVDPSAGVKLLHHLGACMRKIDVDTGSSPPPRSVTTATANTADQYRPYTPPSTPGSELKDDPNSVWRPW
jgi:hairy-and-enhancer-of-split protein